MGKRILLAVAALTCGIVLTGCSGSTSNEISGTQSSAFSGFAASDYVRSNYNAAEESEVSYDSADGGSGSANPAVNDESKKIYTGTIDMETTAFSSVYSSIREAAESSGAWLESDSSGTSGIGGARYASLTIRVPADQFDGLMEGLEGLENVTVTSKSISAEDVSEEYYDIEGRLENAEAKLKNLQKLSEEAENVQDLITIEDSISDVQYTIEYLQGQINHYDSQISYSYIYVSLYEVNVMSGHEEGYGLRLAESFKSGFVEGVDFLGNVLLWIAQNWLVLLAAILAAVVLLAGIHKLRKGRKTGKAKKE